MKHIALLLIAWLAGLLSYVANLRLFYAEGISPGDLGAVALAIVPVALILAVWRGLSLEALISDETRLFWAFFIPVGVVLGHGFTWLYRDRAA